MRTVSSSPSGRIRLLSICCIGFALLLGARLYMLQVMDGAAFRERADRQYSNPSQRVFDRGSIFFETYAGNRISAASLKSGYTLALNPKLVENVEGTYEALSAITPLDKEQFMESAAKKDDPYEEVAKRVPQEAADKIEALKLPGVRLFKERWRYYPNGDLASHVLGFMGYKGDEYSGRYGLESYYNDVLQRGSKNLYTNFFAEIFSNINKKLLYQSEGEGDIVSTIEPNVQLELEKNIKAVNKKYQSKETAGIIMDPKTGEIYAMASFPAYDPNFFQAEKDAGVYNNPLVQNVYEMGSIIKPITMAAGIDAGVVTPTSTYFDAGSLTLNNKTIYNYDKRGRGVTTMQEVLNQSLNTGVAHVVQLLGRKRFADYLFKAGFGEQTHIDLPAEATNLVDNLKAPRDIEYATASFGQGIALTPITTARALAAVGNGGYLVTPHVVKKIEYTSGMSKTPVFDTDRRVWSTTTSQTLSKMLTTVVDTALLGGTMKMEHYSIAAKTGTAQIAIPGKGYYEDRYLHSFFGYFPSYDPKFIVFMYTYDPRGEEYASHTLTEPFFDIAQFLINYYEVPPDR